MTDLMLLGVSIVASSLLFLQSVLKTQEIEDLEWEKDELKQRLEGEAARCRFLGGQLRLVQDVNAAIYKDESFTQWQRKQKEKVDKEIRALSPLQVKALFEGTPKPPCRVSFSPEVPQDLQLPPAPEIDLRREQYLPPISSGSLQFDTPDSQSCTRCNTKDTNE